LLIPLCGILIGKNECAWRGELHGAKMQTMKSLLIIITVFCSSIVLAQNVGIGTTVPATSLKLHVHDGVNPDASIGITNVTTGNGNLRGARLRMLSNIFSIDNYEPAGSLYFGTNVNTRMYIGPNGNVGIGLTIPHPSAALHLNVGDSITKGLLVTGQLSTSASVPDLNAGSRMMFYPGRGAFRAGHVFGAEWNNANVGLYSTATGLGTTASGQVSTAMGVGSIASGANSTAFGDHATASGNSAIAMGFFANASGDESVAIGNAIATGLNSRSIGSSTIASGNVSVAMNLGTKASGYASTAMGFGNTARGFASTAIGYLGDSLISSDGNFLYPETPLFIVGNGATAVNRSNAFVVRYDGNVGVGNIIPQYNLDVAKRMRLRGDGTLGGTAGIWLNNPGNTATDAFFGVFDNSHFGLYGNTGAGWGLVMNQASGNIGMGTTNPQTRLHLLRDNETLRLQGASSYISFYNNANNYIGYLWNAGDASIDLGTASGSGLPVTISPGTATTATFTASGNVGIGTGAPSQRLHVVGNICATGTISACSDIRYKTAFAPVQNALQSVQQIHPVYYHWKKEYKDKGFANERQLGFSAQEIEQLYPEMVQTDNEGYKAVDYSRMTVVLLQAVKEQQQMITALQAELADLKKLIRKNRN
jgi:hypothetical protein